MTLKEIVNVKIKEAQKDVNKLEQIQSLIHTEINLDKNSVKFMVCKHLSGKTLNAFREVIKIDLLSHHPDSQPLSL
jgi:hypothetical protein